MVMHPYFLFVLNSSEFVFRTIGSPALLLLPIIVRVPLDPGGQQLPQAAGGGDRPLLKRLVGLLLLPEKGGCLLLNSILLILPPRLSQPLSTRLIRLPHVSHVTNVLPFRTWRLPVRLPAVKRLRLPRPCQGI